MAVAVQFDFRGLTLEDYDRINEAMGMLPGGPASSNELFHWVAATDDGFRVVDVWESREAFEEFQRGKLARSLEDAGVNEPPEVRFFEIHNYLAGVRWR